MPNVKSARKRVRTNERRQIRNRLVRSTMRTAIRRVHEAIKTGDAEAVQKRLPIALKTIGKTAQKGVIHRNKAARKESRLRKHVNAFLANQQQG